MKTWIANVFVVLALSLAPPVAAQDFDKELKAAQRADIATALREWKPRVTVLSDPSTSWWETYQSAWSTIISAIVGFGGLIFATYAGLKANRKSQETQAREDRKARREQYQADRRMEIQRRDDEGRALANALAAELMEIETALGAFANVAGDYADNLEAYFSKNPDKILQDIPATVIWRAPCAVYHANLNRLGLLPVDVAASVVRVISLVHSVDTHQTAAPPVVIAAIRGNKDLAEQLRASVRRNYQMLQGLVKPDDEPELPFPDLADAGVRLK